METSNAKAALDTHVEEFGSITLVIDHLVTDRSEGDPVVIKTVYSNESACEALVAQMAYFGESELALDRGVRAMLTEGDTKDVMYVYGLGVKGAHREHTQVIVDIPMFNRALVNTEFNPDGSLMGCMAGLIAQATALQARAAEAGEGSPILLFVEE